MNSHIVSVNSSTAKDNHNSNRPSNQFVHTVLKSALREESHITDINSIHISRVTKKQDSTMEEINEREIGSGYVSVEYIDTYGDTVEDELVYGIFVSEAEDGLDYSSVEVTFI